MKSNSALVGLTLLFLAWVAPAYADQRFYATLTGAQQLGNGRLATIVSYNPLIPFFDLIREPIIQGTVPGPLTFLRAGLTVLLAGLVATFVCNRAQRQLIFHL